MSSNANDDAELRDIVDKFAQFVARNGAEFENLTKQKQVGNPKFAFLYGGELYQYYQYRLALERSALAHQQQTPNSARPPPPSSSGYSGAAAAAPPTAAPQPQPLPLPLSVISSIPPPTFPGARPFCQPPMPPMPPPPNVIAQYPPRPPITIESIQQQIQSLQQKQQALKEQITHSSNNLKAQFDTLTNAKVKQIEHNVGMTRKARIQVLAAECNIDLAEFERVIASISEFCTKENILNGKMVILQFKQSQKHAEAIALFLLDKVLETDVSFERRLHIIYLVNDVLFHCIRKNVDDLKREFEKVIVPMFAAIIQNSDAEKQSKLLKLLDLWQKNNYFDVQCLNAMRNVENAANNIKEYYETAYPGVIVSVQATIDGQFAQFEKQHNEFVSHTENQIQQYENQIEQLKNQSQQLKQQQQQQQQQQQHQQQQQTTPQAPQHKQQQQQQQPKVNVSAHPTPPPLMGINPFEVHTPSGLQLETCRPKSRQSRFEPCSSDGFANAPPPPPPPFNPTTPPPLFDPSQPPPGFLPPDAPPPRPFPKLVPEKLLTTAPPVAVDTIPPPLASFSSNQANVDETIPDFPYYDLPAGLMCPLVKLEDCDYEPLDPKAIRLPPPQPPSEHLLKAIEEFYSQPTEDKPRNADGWESMSLYEFYRQKQKHKFLKLQREKRSARSSSVSSTEMDDESSTAAEGDNARLPPQISVPVGFRENIDESGVNLNHPLLQGSTTPSVRPLDESNKGHQLLQKMGWAGTGLGKKEQGIVEPISGGEIRDNVDKYRGVGSESDPYDLFRRARSQLYMQSLNDK